MLRPMFGMGFSEIVVILVVALIFLGPEKLPGAAKSISKGIRDLRKQTRELQSTIENDEHIGGAIRDLRSAMRGEEPPPRPPKPPPGVPVPGEQAKQTILPPSAKPPDPAPAGADPAVADSAVADSAAAPPAPPPADKPAVRLPEVVGEGASPADNDTEGLDKLVRPADGTVAKGS
jgi:sec-independent protein translocase protein TatB